MGRRYHSYGRVDWYPARAAQIKLTTSQFFSYVNYWKWDYPSIFKADIQTIILLHPKIIFQSNLRLWNLKKIIENVGGLVVAPIWLHTTWTSPMLNTFIKHSKMLVTSTMTSFTASLRPGATIIFWSNTVASHGRTKWQKPAKNC